MNSLVWVNATSRSSFSSSMASTSSSMASISLLLLSLCLLFQTHLSFPPFDDFHDLLPPYGFPKGLIPSTIKFYSISDSGEFDIHMHHSCYVQFNKLVFYDKKIRGRIEYGSVTNVTGIQTKKLFFWVPVTGIDSSLGFLRFHTGPLSARLPAKQFESVPICKHKILMSDHAFVRWFSFNLIFFPVIFSAVCLIEWYGGCFLFLFDSLPSGFSVGTKQI